MKDFKDPAIKLFGMKIEFPIFSDHMDSDPTDCVPAADSESDRSLMANCCLDAKKMSIVVDGKEAEKDPVLEKQLVTEDLKDPETVAQLQESPKTSSMEDESANPDDPKTENDQITLKKPDKIIPCPRCESMDTKFCYYNNYNVNQPRYFCKSCQRYWTAGGTMRNVPVGAGRRKNKNISAPHCRHITISESLGAARVDIPNGIHLSFGSDNAASVLNLASEKKAQNFPEARDDCSSGSSITTTSNSMEDGARNGVHEPIEIPMLRGVPWPYYHWNSAVAVPTTFCPPPPGYPMPFYPPPYWSVPWLSPPCPSMNQNFPNTPNLGKHSREGDLLNARSVLIPKTLRIDDPDEAAKSSIWATLGIKNESLNRGGLFKGFQLNKDDGKKCHNADASPALRANPAAMSRSFSFQETS